MRDDRTIEIMSHFSKSIVLGEKPSHGKLADAVAFKKSLAES